MFVYSASVLLNLIKEDVTTKFSVFLCVLILVRIFQHIWKCRSLPPGPWGIPVYGSLLKLKGDLHLFYRDLAHQYGSIFSAKLGSQLYIVLSDHKLIRDAFRREEFTGRPSTQLLSILDGYGVINTSGRLWKDQRRFLHDGLRHFGMSYLSSRKGQMEKRIGTEVNGVLTELKKSNGQPVDLNPIFAVSISNVICDVLMSVKFSHNDARFNRFMKLITEGFDLFGSLEYAIFIPIMQYIPAKNKTMQKIVENREELAQFFQEKINEHRSTFDPSHLRDLLDTYLYEIQKANEAGVGDKLFEGKDHDRQIQQVLGDLFSAGMETTKTSLQWAVLFMLHYPQHMKAVQEELDQVIGRQRLPQLEDLAYLPVTEATICEVLRISSIVPMGTTHSPIRDVEFNGFVLPRNAHIVPLLHAVHMDPTHWHEPEKFDPSRFINNEGKIFKPDYFLPFGVGRRMCLGEVMARMEIFLFFSSLLHTFEVSLPDGETLPCLKGIAGVTISPKPYTVCLKQRQTDWDEEMLRPVGSR